MKFWGELEKSQLYKIHFNRTESDNLRVSVGPERPTIQKQIKYKNGQKWSKMVKNVGIAVWLKLHQIQPNKFYYTHIKMPNIMQLKRNESAHWELKLKIDILVKWLKLTKAPVQSLSLAHALSLRNRECIDPVFWKVLAFAKTRGNACISCTNRTQLSASFSPTLPSFSHSCVAIKNS